MKKRGINLSLSSQGLKYKLEIAFCLMSVLPLLVSAYIISTYLLPKMGFQLDRTITIASFVSIVIAVIGFFLIKEVFDRIVSVSSEAKRIAAGDVSRRIPAGHADEVGDLGDALNLLTQRIRANMDELKNYGEKTNAINMEIQRRVIVLSSLLQISSLISQGAQLEDILKITVEKSRFLANTDTGYLFFREEGKDVFSLKVADGVSLEHLRNIHIELRDSLFNKLITSNKPLIVDKKNTLTPEAMKDFSERLRMKNTAAVPISLKGKTVGIFGIASTKEVSEYKKDDLELLDIFSKQIAIAIENDMLIHRVEKLEIKDALTGLYNETFIHNRLQEEIKRAVAYQRPCALIMIDIDDFEKYFKSFGLLQSETALKKIAGLVRESVTEIDRVGRVGDDEFAVVLPEKNKRKALEKAEEIRKKIEEAFSAEADVNKKITVSGSVSENPLDGLEADELILKARETLVLAKREGKNRIANLVKV